MAAVVIAHRPPFTRAGRTLLWVVAGFGLATVVFGLSESFWLSLVMLALLGGLDNVSVVIRSALVLTLTPDAMRGRVNAVHFVFIGISNELGAFESGLAAALLGAVGAVVAGGLGTIGVVLLVALAWPEVRRLGRLGPSLAVVGEEYEENHALDEQPDNEQHRPECQPEGGRRPAIGEDVRVTARSVRPFPQDEGKASVAHHAQGLPGYQGQSRKEHGDA
jgi:MFS family permease